MDPEDSPPANKEDSVYVLDASRGSVFTSNEPGPSGTQQPPARSSKKQHRRGRHSQDDLILQRDEGSEIDSDLERDSACSGSPGDCQTFLLENGQMTSNTKQKSTNRRKGGRRRREKMSIEELIRKQETASQTHNENERFRRKELRSALLGLRKQLRTPTKRPAVKMVLEAAIKELQELKNNESRNAKHVESLKDKERRLTLELESKKKEYEKCRENGPSVPSQPSPTNTTPMIVSPSVLPGVTPMPWFPTIYNPTPRPDSRAIPQINPHVMPPVPLYPWLPLSQTLTSPTLNLTMPGVFNGFTPLSQVPVLNGTSQLRLQGIPPLHPIQTAAAFPTLTPSAYTPAAFSPRVGMPIMHGFTNGSPLLATRSPEPQRVATIVTPQSNKEEISSKNAKESVERPTSVSEYTNSADSETIRPVKRTSPFSIDSLGICTSERKTKLIEDSESDEPITVEVEHTISTFMPSPPLCQSKRRLQRKAPPLLKIDNEHLLGFTAIADKNGATEPPFQAKIHAVTENDHTDLVTVHKYDNPFYNRNPRFQQSPQRWNTSHTDSDSSEDDVPYLRNRLSTTLYSQTHSKSN